MFGKKKTIGIYGQFALLVKYPGEPKEGYLLVDGINVAVKLDKTIYPKIFFSLDAAYTYGLDLIINHKADRFVIQDWISHEKYPAIIRSMVFRKSFLKASFSADAVGAQT